jgi:hypothetical protein
MGRRRTNGRSATSRPASRTPRSSSTDIRRAVDRAPADGIAQRDGIGRTGRSISTRPRERRAHARSQLAQRIGIPASKIVLISEFCGGGLAAQRRGLDGDSGAPVEEGSAPVMMRISREESTTSVARAPG